MNFRACRSAPRGTALKKSPDSNAQRSAAPAAWMPSSGLRLDVRQVEDLALHLGVLLENREREAAVAAADVHDRPDAREVVGLEHGGRGKARDVLHGLAELRALVRVLAVVVEGGQAENFLRLRPARAHGVRRHLPGPPVHRIRLGDEGVPESPGHVAAQPLADRGQRETAVREPLEDADARQARAAGGRSRRRRPPRGRRPRRPSSARRRGCPGSEAARPSPRIAWPTRRSAAG